MLFIGRECCSTPRGIFGGPDLDQSRRATDPQSCDDESIQSGLLLGIAAVALMAVCIESAQKVEPCARCSHPSADNAGLWLALAGVLA